MKTKFIALAIASTFTASAFAVTFESDNGKAELFGKVAVQHKTTHENANGDDSYARVGVSGEHKIKPELVAFGLIEGEYSLGKSGDQNGVTARQGYAGLRFDDAVSMSYGRQDGALKSVLVYTDILPASGGSASMGGDDFWLHGIADNVLSVDFHDVYGTGLTGKLQYQAKDESETDSTNSHGENYGAAIHYDTKIGLKLGAAYTQGARAEDLVNAEIAANGGKRASKHAESWAVAASYELDALTLAAMYVESRNQNYFSVSDQWGDKTNLLVGKLKGFELVATYKTDFGLTPAIGWNTAHVSDIQGVRNYRLKTVDYVSFGASYDLSKNASVSAAYNLNLLGDREKAYKAVGISNDDSFKVSLAYTF